MRTHALATALVLLVPTAVALPLVTPGLPIAGQPPVMAGETRVYSDTVALVVDDLVVEDGGRLIVSNSTLYFARNATIEVRAGGTLELANESLLVPLFDDVAFGISLASGSTGRLVDSELRNATGVVVRTSDVSIDGMRFVDNLLAIDAANVTLLVERTTFKDSEVAIRARDSTLTVENSTMLGGIRGVDAQGGSATLRYNTLDEHMGPDTIGARLIDMDQVTLHANVFREWGTGAIVGADSATFEDNVWSTIVRAGIVLTRGAVTVTRDELVSIDGRGIQAIADPGETLVANFTEISVRVYGTTALYVENAEASVYRAEFIGGSDGIRAEPGSVVEATWSYFTQNGHAGFFAAQGSDAKGEQNWFEDNPGLGAGCPNASVDLSMRRSYWGHPSGPTTPGGPLFGDEVTDGVDFAEFLTAPPF